MIHINPNDSCRTDESREKVVKQPQPLKKKLKQLPKKLFVVADDKKPKSASVTTSNDEPSKTSSNTSTFGRRRSLSNPGLLALLPPALIEDDEKFVEGLIFFAPSCERNIRDIYCRGGSRRNIKQG